LLPGKDDLNIPAAGGLDGQNLVRQGRNKLPLPVVGYKGRPGMPFLGHGRQEVIVVFLEDRQGGYT
jgi:hypothetical protein